jgi:hypothetical protein
MGMGYGRKEIRYKVRNGKNLCGVVFQRKGGGRNGLRMENGWARNRKVIMERGGKVVDIRKE